MKIPLVFKSWNKHCLMKPSKLGPACFPFKYTQNLNLKGSFEILTDLRILNMHLRANLIIYRYLTSLCIMGPAINEV